MGTVLQLYPIYVGGAWDPGKNKATNRQGHEKTEQIITSITSPQLNFLTTITAVTSLGVTRKTKICSFVSGVFHYKSTLAKNHT